MRQCRERIGACGVTLVAGTGDRRQDRKTGPVPANHAGIAVKCRQNFRQVSPDFAAARAKAKYVFGLSATVTRLDGHHPIVFMQCGPVRFRTHAREEARRLGGVGMSANSSVGYEVRPAGSGRELTGRSSSTGGS